MAHPTPAEPSFSIYFSNSAGSINLYDDGSATRRNVHLPMTFSSASPNTIDTLVTGVFSYNVVYLPSSHRPEPEPQPELVLEQPVPSPQQQLLHEVPKATRKRPVLEVFVSLYRTVFKVILRRLSRKD